MKCGAFAVYPDAVVNSARWVHPFARQWAVSSLIRSERHEEIERQFSRVSIATIGQPDIDYFSATYSRALIQAIDELSKRPDQLNLRSPGFSQRLIPTLSNLLSRLCFRFSADQRRELLDLTLMMYRSQLFYRTAILHQCVSKPLHSLLEYAMSRAEVMERMADLLSLPIPTEAGFDVDTPQWWPEPFNSLTWLPEVRLKEGFDTSAWSPAVANLIRIVSEGDAEARKRASLRLGILSDLAGLSNEQRLAFGSALWSRVDEQKGLPKDLLLRDNVVLRLPDVEGGSAKDRFRRYILSTDFPHFSQRESGAKGQQQLSTQISFESNPYIAEILGATAPLFSDSEKDKEKYIDWSQDEAVAFLRKAMAWWDNDKLALQLNRQTMFGDVIIGQFLNLLDFLGEVILPRLGDAAEEDKELAKRLLSEMEEFGVSTMLALPMILFVNPDQVESVIQKLRTGLNSMRVEDVAKASYGLYLWLAYSSKGSIVPPPEDLIGELINRLVSRRQPGLLYVMADVARVLRRLPETFTASQLQSVCIALEYLFAETTLPSSDALRAEWTSPIAIEEWAEYRRAASKIAFQMAKYYAKNNEQPPEIVARWKVESLSDRLPEVRRVWEEA
jgi:hypothetical protein